jgi:drug/metabolite transporter (DMT)-like permease
MLFGLALALGSAFGTNVGFLLKQRGAVAAPPVDGRHPLRSAADLFRSHWWTVGWLVALGAWALHAGALSLAPLSQVQAVLSGGLVFLAVLAERYFGFHLGRRQWIGVAVTAIGLAALALTSDHDAGDTGRYSLAGLIAVEAAVFAIAGLLVAISVRARHSRERQGMLLGAAAGALFGVSDVAIKYLSHTVPSDPLALISPWTGAALAASIVAFYASARGLQVGPGVEVIVLTSVAANVAAILGGVLVFQESIGNGAVGVIARTGAFVLVIAGGAMMPAPTRIRRPRRRRGLLARRSASDPSSGGRAPAAEPPN